MVKPVIIKPPVELLYTNTRTITVHQSRQTKPYDLAAPYKRHEKIYTYVEDPLFFIERGLTAKATWPHDAPLLRVAQKAYNKAYERFVSQLGDTSSFGATITAERRESYGMIRDLTIRLLKSARAAKRGDILTVAEQLGLKPRVVRTRTVYRRRRRKTVVTRQQTFDLPNGRRVVKNSASVWLLWSYGASPLISDVHNATEVFVRDHPSHVIRSSATADDRITYMEGGYFFYHDTRKLRSTAGLSGHVKVDNPDLWLANQLGLINPIQWVNEAIPFSFVVDWASNWSSVINSMSDFAGLTLSNTCWFEKIVEENDLLRNTYGSDGKIKVLGYNRKKIDFTRTVGGFPRPQLIFSYERFQWQRALNAISLLVGFLPRK